jgi:hypothetical protein
MVGCALAGALIHPRFSAARRRLGRWLRVRSRPSNVSVIAAIGGPRGAGGRGGDYHTVSAGSDLKALQSGNSDRQFDK